MLGYCCVCLFVWLVVCVLGCLVGWLIRFCFFVGLFDCLFKLCSLACLMTYVCYCLFILLGGLDPLLVVCMFVRCVVGLCVFVLVCVCLRVLFVCLVALIVVCLCG